MKYLLKVIFEGIVIAIALAVALAALSRWGFLNLGG